MGMAQNRPLRIGRFLAAAVCDGLLRAVGGERQWGQQTVEGSR